jgi:hypothetical protein
MNAKRFEAGDVVTFSKVEIISGANDVKSLLKTIHHYRLIPEKVLIPIRSVKEYHNLPDEKNGFGEVGYRKIGMCVDTREHKLLAVYNIKPRFAHLANTYVRIKY